LRNREERWVHILVLNGNFA